VPRNSESGLEGAVCEQALFSTGSLSILDGRGGGGESQRRRNHCQNNSADLVLFLTYSRHRYAFPV
jgi:hypothetical protein